MNAQEIQEFYKKNKVVAIGVPVILGVLILDNFILKPRRVKPETAATHVTASTAPTQPVAGAPAVAVDPLKPPPPLITPNIPLVDPRVDSRFITRAAYPYGETRDVFLAPQEEIRAAEPMVFKAPVEKFTETPDIAYHGFFTMGLDRVAIMKANSRLALSRMNTKITDTSFILHEIHPDKVILLDTRNDNRPFEINLTSTNDTSSFKESPSNPISKLRASSSTP